MSMRDMILNRLDAVLFFLRSVCLFAATICMATLILSFGWLVFGRYVLNATPTWVEQLALLLVGYIAFLGAAVGVYDDTHLGVVFFRDSFKPWITRWLRNLSDIVVSGFGLIMFLASFELVKFGLTTQLPMLNIPESFRSAAAAIFGGLVFLFAGLRAIRRILGQTPATDVALAKEI